MLPWLWPEGGNFPNMFCQFMIPEIFPYYTVIIWYIRVTARNGGTHLKKPKNGGFQYLDTPPTLRPKNSIKELTDLVNFFNLYSEADPYMLKQKSFEVKGYVF